MRRGVVCLKRFAAHGHRNRFKAMFLCGSGFTLWAGHKATKRAQCAPLDSTATLELKPEEVGAIVDHYFEYRKLQNSFAAAGCTLAVLADMFMLTGTGLIGLTLAGTSCALYVYSNLQPVLLPTSFSFPQLESGTPKPRLRFIDLKEEMVGLMGLHSANAIQQKSKFLSASHSLSQRCEALGKKVEGFCEVDLPFGQTWKFFVVDDSERNASVLPSGHVFVSRGLFEQFSDDEIAVVLCHEIAHVQANHYAERVSLSRFPTILHYTSTFLMMLGFPISTGDVHLGGLASSLLFMLPYSRLHEEEADMIGLDFLVKMLIHPRTALKLWDKMSKLEAVEKATRGSPSIGNRLGQEVLSLASTHPSHAARRAALEKLMPAAEASYYSLLEAKNQ